MNADSPPSLGKTKEGMEKRRPLLSLPHSLFTPLGFLDSWRGKRFSLLVISVSWPFGLALVQWANTTRVCKGHRRYIRPEALLVSAWYFVIQAFGNLEFVMLLCYVVGSLVSLVTTTYDLAFLQFGTDLLYHPIGKTGFAA